MSTLYHRNGVVYIDYSHEGRQVRRSLKIKLVGGKIPPAAREIQRKIDAEIALGIFGVKHTRRISIDDFYTKYEAHRKAHSTGRRSGVVLLQVKKLRDHFSGRSLDSITTEEADMWLNKMAEGKKGITANGYRRAAKAFFNQAIAWEHLTKSPFRNVKKFKEGTLVPRVLSAEELKEIRSAADERQPKIRDYFYLYMLTGMRMGEPLTLTWRDIDFDRGIIRLQETKTHKGRVIFFSQKVREILESRRMMKQPFGEWIGNEDELSKAFTDLFRAAGVKNASLKTLRSNYASYLSFAGIPENINNSLLGHTKEVSRRHYLGVVADHIRDGLKHTEEALLQ